MSAIKIDTYTHKNSKSGQFKLHYLLLERRALSATSFNTSYKPVGISQTFPPNERFHSSFLDWNSLTHLNDDNSKELHHRGRSSSHVLYIKTQANRVVFSYSIYYITLIFRCVRYYIAHTVL